MRHSKQFRSLLGVTLLATVTALGASADVEHGNVQVIQNDANNNATSVTLTKASGTANFSVVPDFSNRGDYAVSFNTSNDFLTGILLTSVRQNGRDNSVLPNVGGYPGQTGLAFATSTISGSTESNLPTSIGYFVPIHQSPDGSEINMDVAVAHFKYEDGWIGGIALNLNEAGGYANNTTLNTFIGASQILMGTNLIDPEETVGIYTLSHPNINSLTGILLVNGAKNEDNYALSQVNPDGTFTIICKDNGANNLSYENDPVAFVYIPATAVNLTAGRVNTDGALLLTIDGGTGAPTVTRIDVGRHRLTIAGQSPATGTLIISPEGGESQNVDNIVTYEADGDGWIIETRDLPAEPPTLQDPRDGDLPLPIFSFAFLPNSGNISPGESTGNTFSGTVTLVDAPACPKNMPLHLTFTPVEGAPINQTVIPNANGLFVSQPVPAGEYRVRMRMARTLSVATDANLTSGNVFSFAASLRSGDADDSNLIDVEDLALLIASFDADETLPNWLNGVADFNCSGIVDVEDLDIFIRNFDASGDE